MPARCFIAIDLPGATRDLLAGARDAVSHADPRWHGEKWVRAEHLHVTVKFIGPIPDAVLGEMVAGLTVCAAQLDPFGLRLAGARAVPGAHRARMLWATLAGDVDAVVAAHAAIEDALAEPLGVDADAGEYAPHVTLVRARRPHAIHHAAVEAADALLSAAGKSPVGYVSVSSLTLYGSTLGPGGPFYRAIAELPFRTGDGSSGGD